MSTPMEKLSVNKGQGLFIAVVLILNNALAMPVQAQAVNGDVCLHNQSQRPINHPWGAAHLVLLLQKGRQNCL